MAPRKKTKKELRILKATNVAARLIKEGTLVSGAGVKTKGTGAKVDVSRLSKKVLSAALGKERRSTPKGQAISTELAKSDAARKKKKTSVR